MEPTHYLYLALPPRPSFVMDATPAEYETLGRHFAYMDRLQAEGKLMLTGPTLDGAYGLAIFKVTDAAEAEALAGNDPAVIEGLFRPNIHPVKLGAITP